METPYFFSISSTSLFENLSSKSNKQKQPLEVFRKEEVFKNFANFAGKHLYWSLFATSLKRDYNTGVFL